MADPKKSRLRRKLPRIPVVSVTNGYAVTIETSIAIVDVQRAVAKRSRSPASRVYMLTD